VSIIPTNKLSIQELNQVIGIKLPTPFFLEFFGFQSKFPGGKNARFDPLGDAHAHRCLFICVGNEKWNIIWQKSSHPHEYHFCIKLYCFS